MMEGLNKFNLLVSTGRGLEDRCIGALKGIMEDVDDNFVAQPSAFSGLVLGVSSVESREAVRHISMVIEKEPWHNLVIKRVVPIDEVVPTDLDAIVVGFKELLKRLHPDRSYSFRVTLRRRGAQIDRREAIVAVADLFDNRVDLEDPDIQARIEVLGKQTGISIIGRDEIFPQL